MDYAVAVNEEIRDLFAAGADIVQVDEPYMQARPQKAEEYGLAALNRVLDGVTGTTAVHICFGYAAIIHERPSGYSFLTQLKNCSCRQVSIETAQSKLDCSVLSQLGGKKVLLGVIDLSDMNVETPEIVASRIRRALPYVPAKNIIIAPDCGMNFLRAVSPSGRCGPWSRGRRSSVRKSVGRPLRTSSDARRMASSSGIHYGTFACAMRMREQRRESRAAELSAGFACSARPPSYRGAAWEFRQLTELAARLACGMLGMLCLTPAP